MALSTSGTVSTYAFDQRKIIEHAFRRAGLQPSNASAEDLEIAQDALFSVLSEWSSAGFPLWTRQFVLLPITIGGADVPCPQGTGAVVHAYWRTFNPWRGSVTLSSGGTSSTLCGGVASSDVTISGTAPSLTFSFGGTTEVDTLGFLPGTGGTLAASLTVSTSPDGTTWTQAQTLASTTFSPGTWSYFDLAPSLSSPFLRITAPLATSWILNQVLVGLANSSEIEIGPLNIDDYWSLPNKFFQSDRPNSAFVDRQLNSPVLKVWPTPSPTAFYGGTITALTKRYIQDPGALSLGVEIPQRGLEALIWRLAVTLIDTLPQADSSGEANSQGGYFALMAKQQKMQRLDQRAQRAEALFWSEERSGGPIRLRPNISPYTC